MQTIASSASKRFIISANLDRCLWGHSGLGDFDTYFDFGFVHTKFD
jgi:hypothetical protein